MTRVVCDGQVGFRRKAVMDCFCRNGPPILRSEAPNLAGEIQMHRFFVGWSPNHAAWIPLFCWLSGCVWKSGISQTWWFIIIFPMKIAMLENPNPLNIAEIIVPAGRSEVPPLSGWQRQFHLSVVRRPSGRCFSLTKKRLDFARTYGILNWKDHF